MTHVLIVGMAVADYQFYVDSLPTAAEKYKANDALVVGGGCAANAAVAISKLSGKATLAARVGDDAVGESILTDLRRYGVDTSLMDRSGVRSSFSSVFVDRNGERQIVNFRGAGLNDQTDHFKEAANIDAILADTRWDKGAMSAMSLAKSRNIPGVLDIETMANPASFADASHLAFSLQGLNNLCPGTPIEAIASIQQKYGGWVCVTLGADGVLVTDGSTTDHIPGYDVNAVDTLGAGDVWHGAFTLELARSGQEGKAVRFANAVAALKCTRTGGREGYPTLEQTQNFLKETAQ